MQYIHHRPSKLPQAKILQLSLQCRQILHSSFFTLHFRFPQKKTDKLLYIDTSLDGILSARVSKLMTTDSPIQFGEVTILTLSEYHTRTNDGKLTMISFASLSPITTSANFGLQFNCFLLCTIIYNHGAKVRNFI